jgi:hypothetical protein
MQRPPAGCPTWESECPKHGAYASVFNRDLLRKLNRVQEHGVDEELALMRLLIRRTVASMPPRADLTPAEVLKIVRILTYAVNCVEKLELTRSLLTNRGSLFDEIIESALREARKDWDLA